MKLHLLFAMKQRALLQGRRRAHDRIARAIDRRIAHLGLRESA